MLRRRELLRLRRDATGTSDRVGAATPSAPTERERELELELRRVKGQLGGMATQLERLEQLVRDSAVPAVAANHADPLPANLKQMTSAQLLKKRNRKYFTESLRRVVEILSLEEGAVPVGSFKYLAFLYPGDIDLFEGESASAISLSLSLSLSLCLCLCLSDSLFLSLYIFEGLFFPFTDRGVAASRAAGRIQTMARRIQLEEIR